ncbi:ATP-grasp domain-containing protein [Chrysiogenes arsenatis]|uniref:ATP-grasp domain-containing protein n=1 Tax=Chrysiogenes arsenatis TaxID=309797 RepID=UPI00040EEE8E|nr:ATP-grasp domain-containing protein [Chrysiogenes arsenatis]
MNIVLLSPHFPPNFRHFSTRLREQGVNVLGIADAPWEELAPELQTALTEYYRTDMSSYENILRACGHFTHRYGKIDRVESHNEYWLETEAQLRQDFNIVGMKPDEIANVTLKSKMKDGFRTAGVATARGTVVKTLDDALTLAGEIGYPAILKPDRGVGAASTYRVDTDEDLRRVFQQKLPTDYFMEEFIRGEIHTYDGLCDSEGNVIFAASHVFHQGIMETVNENRDLFYYSQREIPADLEMAGRNAVQAFNIREKFFHIEFFRTFDEQKLMGIEVNMRPPGGLTMDMFNYANNADLFGEWANIVAGKYFGAHCTRPYFCAYIGRKEGKQYRHSHEEIMQHYAPLIVHAETISSVFSAAIGNFGYIARAQDLEELENLAHYIHEQ